MTTGRAPRLRPRIPTALRVAVMAAAVIALVVPAQAMASVSPGKLTDGGLAAAPNASTITLTKVVDLPQPVLAIGAGDGSGRLFVVLKGGQIRIIKNRALLPTPFLDISGTVTKGNEQGLLGLAFHPKFATNHKLYVDFTNLDGDTVVREYRTSATNPNVVDPSTARTILFVRQPFANHNGGMLAIGPDRLLYVGLGDGGSGGDPGNRAQDRNNLLGKILRINVNHTSRTRNYVSPGDNPYVGRAGRDEVWQLGLRNPWRFSFDTVTGNLWIGDVGQERFEEVDRATNTATGPGRGVNWGWHVMEGNACYDPGAGCSTAGLRRPMTEYSHVSGQCAITGGYMYRGKAIPALSGWYVYGDYCSGEVWAVAANAPTPATAVQLVGLGSGHSISGFGRDDAGELYLCDLNGSLYRIDAAP